VAEFETLVRRRSRPVTVRPKSVERGSVALVQLGRYGDLVNILPIALHIHNTYRKPHLVVSREFADVLDGVSYVTPYIVELPCEAILEAMAEARSRFEHVIQTQVWGRGYDQVQLAPSYSAEMWRMAGMLPRYKHQTLMPLFDKADQVRGMAALLKTRKQPTLPYILTNLTYGHSSPFPDGPKVLQAIQDRWGSTHEVIDVGGLKLERIYDLITFIDGAKAVVSVDSSLIHLATGRGTPIVALVNPAPWSGTIGRVPMERIPYSQASIKTVLAATYRALNQPPTHRHHQGVTSPPKRRIFHALSHFEPNSDEEKQRRSHARRSWARLYDAGEMIPAWFSNPTRTMPHYNEAAQLPFLKDVLAPALEQADADDIIVYSNDDIIFHPELPGQLRFYCSVWGCVAARRVELSPHLPVPSFDASPEEWIEVSKLGGIPHEGRDTYAFTKKWFDSIAAELPDFVIGATDWDNCLISIMRRHCGYRTDQPSLRGLIWPTEMPVGWTAHIHHTSLWRSFGNFWHSPANNYNRALFRAWAERMAPELKFDDSNLLVST
jgi:hypothetical protein